MGSDTLRVVLVFVGEGTFGLASGVEGAPGHAAAVEDRDIDALFKVLAPSDFDYLAHDKARPLPAVAWRAVVCGQCGVSIAEFRNNDAAFLAWLSAHGDGYVINIGRGGHGYARLHRADCGTITRRPPLTGPYIKICSVSLAELGHWSAQRPGATVSSCGTCHP